jgi:hypothetical protein
VVLMTEISGRNLRNNMSSKEVHEIIANDEIRGGAATGRNNSAQLQGAVTESRTVAQLQRAAPT